jgi:hypothetical protein
MSFKKELFADDDSVEEQNREAVIAEVGFVDWRARADCGGAEFISTELLRERIGKMR